MRNLLLILALLLSLTLGADAHKVKSPYAFQGSLGSDPNDCGANTFATAIDASANLSCGAITDADVPDTIAVNQGVASFVICGEATTINNNTVFYGPDNTLTTANGGQTCDINAVGNTTEATADAPVYTAKAFQVVSMVCRNEADANANISFTLRSAAAATTPSVTCTINDNVRDCIADIHTTTAIASGATVAIAAASTGNIADNNGFVCTVYVRF